MSDQSETTSVQIARLEERVRVLMEAMDECVTQKEFALVRMIVYGLASATGLTVLAALLKLVIAS
jgi:hypothetical protein